jgi:hypothetical protein
MKDVMKTKPFFLILLLGIVLGTSVVADGAKDSAPTSYAEIVFVQGEDLLILRSDGQAVSGEPIGIRLYAGDQIQTGAKTSAELVTMPRKSRLRLSENTVVTIGTLGDDGSTTLKLIYGRLRSKVEKLAGTKAPYNVVARSFVAGVRGTDFGCDSLIPRAGEQASSRIYCFEGSVEVKPTQIVPEAEKKENQAENEGQTDSNATKEEIPAGPIVVSAGGMALIEEKGQGKPADIVERPIDIEIKAFWKANEFTEVQPTAAIASASDMGLAPGFKVDLDQIEKGIKEKNKAMGGALLIFACGTALDIASSVMRSRDTQLSEGLLSGGAACAAMGIPIMIYAISIKPLKGIKR